MRLVADLHIHSRYSLATSSKLTPPRLDGWARIKGINLLGTGDCTHPAWLAELGDRLEPVEEGLFALKASARKGFRAEALAEGLSDSGAGTEVRFVLTGEVCTIFSRGGKTRKVHHLVILPDFAAAAAFQARLSRVAKIESDGRPILGLDSRDLFALLLEADDRSILVPAHIWTPWFSALGGRSGFDSIDECYGDLAPRIGAIETGLSSNPPMNWAVSALDRFAVISNSDAHSPEKLGREATLIDMDVSFSGLARALSGDGPRGEVTGTIEFFPQEGKYHYDGHRSCGVVLSPEESGDGRCPVCGKPLTPGVLRRVCELADRPVEEAAACPADYENTNRRPYRSLIPLKEILSELLGTGESSKKITAAYGALVERAGSEFSLLLDMSEKEIESMRTPGVSGELLAAAIGRMREGRVSIKPGYDGEYGEVRVFGLGERIADRSEAGLFAAEEPPASYEENKYGENKAERDAGNPSRTTGRKTAGMARGKAKKAAVEKDAHRTLGRSGFSLDPSQERAINHGGGPALIVAGPGTGKTAVLALRIERLVNDGIDPASILALTFTNKAAAELRERIGKTIGEEKTERLTAATFHSFCRSVLRDRADDAGISADFLIVNDEERASFLEAAAVAAGLSRSARKLGAYIEERKRFLLRPGERTPRLGPAVPAGLTELIGELGLPPPDPALEAGYAAYRDALRAAHALDFDDLVAGTVRLFAARSETLDAYRTRFRHVFVDEYQDVNFSQYALIRLLAPGTAGLGELCVIGDPNQAIYGFRGADRRFIDRFLADYPDAATYRLSRSFRCAPTIIGAAGRLVGAELVGSGEDIILSRTEAATDKAEAELIAREIDGLIGGTRFFALDSKAADSRTADAGPPDQGGPAGASLRSLAECAILVRAASMAPAIETALCDHGIPYVLVGERPWWDEEPAKTLTRSLRSPDLKRRLSRSSAAEAVAFAAADLERTGTAVDGETLGHLRTAATFHRDLASFLDFLALGAPADGFEKKLERVALMTIHAAKGLEFDHVFVAGLEEGILPFTLYDGRGEDETDGAGGDERIEEERRLLYVAMTRARFGLHLSSAKARIFRGRKLTLPPSRFLLEIEDLLTETAEGPRRPRDPQLGLF